MVTGVAPSWPRNEHDWERRIPCHRLFGRFLICLFQRLHQLTILAFPPLEGTWRTKVTMLTSFTSGAAAGAPKPGAGFAITLRMEA